LDMVPNMVAPGTRTSYGMIATTMTADGLKRGAGVEPRLRWSTGGFSTYSNSGSHCGHSWQYIGIIVPHWAVFLLLIVFPAVQLRKPWTRRQRRKRGLCLNCGYDLRASREVCPECGSGVWKMYR
jgi:hypothetical protein